MGDLLVNISSFMRGCAVIFYIMLCVMLCSVRERNSPLRILYWTMLFMAFLQIKDIVFLYEPFWYNNAISKIAQALDYLYIPAVALLFFECLSPGFVNLRRVLAIGGGQALLLLAVIIHPEGIINDIALWYAFASGISFTIMVFVASLRVDRFIGKNYSYTERIDASWVRWSAIALLLSLLVYVAVMRKETWLGDSLYLLSTIASWTFITILAFRHEVVPVPANILGAASHPTPVEPETVPAGLAAKLEAAMSHDELYLNPRLSLEDVAAHLGTNRTYLSVCINRDLGKSFLDYVNSWRVRKACTILDSPERTSLTVKELSACCGFNSVSTFGRAFRKFTGCSPSNYHL